MRANLKLGVVLLASCLAAGGCKSQEKAKEANVTGTTATPEAKPGAEGAAPAKKAEEKKKEPAVTAEAVKKEALALLAAWTKAQNDGDQATYFGMYDQKHFTGVKRTTKGTVKQFDFAGWKGDRGKMFVNKPTVAAEEATVKTWLDAGEKLKPGVSVIRFTQRWKTAKYADHGIKVLHVWREPSKGKLWIVYEDLLNAEVGWDDKPEAGVEELSVAAPKDDDEALALWHKLAPTGADYPEKLASLPDEPAVTRAMARVLLQGGNLACDKKIEYDECGTEYSEWEPLDPKSTWNDPCLRRRLAIWALEDAGLTEADLNAGVTAELQKALALAKPEEELPEAIMELVSSMSEPTRVDFIGEAAEAGRRDLAEAALTGLSDASLVTLYKDNGLDAAVKQLDVKKHRAVLVTALADTKLDVATRHEVLDGFNGIKGDDIKAALVQVADDDDCELAMDAAVELAARGDSSKLPKKPDNTDVQAHARAICMLMHDPDASRAETRLNAFLPRKGGATITEEVENTFDNYGDEGDDEGGEPEEPPEPETINQDNSLSPALDEAFGQTEPSCGGTSCQVETGSGNFTVSFEIGKDGKLYISDLHTYRWMGCGC
jgi:hypothetical protein